MNYDCIKLVISRFLYNDEIINMAATCRANRNYSKLLHKLENELQMDYEKTRKDIMANGIKGIKYMRKIKLVSARCKYLISVINTSVFEDTKEYWLFMNMIKNIHTLELVNIIIDEYSVHCNIKRVIIRRKYVCDASYPKSAEKVEIYASDINWLPLNANLTVIARGSLSRRLVDMPVGDADVDVYYRDRITRYRYVAAGGKIITNTTSFIRDHSQPGHYLVCSPQCTSIVH